MSQALERIGHAVKRLFGSNFSTNKVEEIGATNNNLWTTINGGVLNATFDIVLVDN